MRPDEARTLLRAFRPKPWPTDRAAAAITIDQMQVDPGAYVVWLSDGLDDEGAAKLTERLQRFDGLQVIVPDQAATPLLLLPPAAEGRDLKVQALRPVADGPRRVAIQAADEQGRTVARIDLDFAANATKGEGTLPAPPELRNRMARLDIEAQGGAGSMVLLDERSRRRPVAILGEKPTANGQPLMQEVYFLEKALDPYVSLTIGDRETVLTRNTAVLLIPDGAAPSAADREEIAKWIEGGGVAVRFAGPNLAAGGDTLVPTRLRLGDRALGGVMSWGQPTALAEFPANSPFLGIPIPKDVRISQQVLAEPTPDLADKTWARLTDGTPLVTAEKRGQGYLVLMHTTANTSWSNMALSGLFVNMLQRLVTLSRGVAGDGVNKALKPWRTLDGFGRLGAPPAGAQILPPDAEETFKPKPTTPPGPLWRRERPGRLQHRRPRGRAQAAGAAGRRLDRQTERRRRDRPVALVPAGGAPDAAGRSVPVAVAARPAGQGGALRRPRRRRGAGGAAAAGRRVVPGRRGARAERERADTLFGAHDRSGFRPPPHSI